MGKQIGGKVKFFEYGDEAKEYLCEKDPVLGAVIKDLGHVNRKVTPDLHTALVQQIVSQQISTKAAETIWGRITDKFGKITPQVICNADIDDIQSCGMSVRKAQYIKNISTAVMDGTLDLAALQEMPDDEVCAKLSELKGIGVWTAEMLMTFSMERPDILSYGDLAIQRGLRMLYRHRKITPELFKKYKRRYSPYGSVASLYLWAIAGGACDYLSDPAHMTEAQKKARRKKK